MTPISRPAQTRGQTRGQTRDPTRVWFGAALALLAAILVIAAQQPRAVTDNRLGRKVELIELIRVQDQQTAALTARVEELSAQVAAFEAESAEDGAVIGSLQQEVERLALPVGLTPVRGAGLVATLTDAAGVPAGADPNDYVIHEEDLQAVVNALWAGGAEAATVSGERVLATTAIRCVGNTLLLHGRTHSPPYVIAVVGDPIALRSALDRDPSVERFRVAVAQFGLGFEAVDAEELELPAYEGGTTLRMARPTETLAS